MYTNVCRKLPVTGSRQTARLHPQSNRDCRQYTANGCQKKPAAAAGRAACVKGGNCARAENQENRCRTPQAPDVNAKRENPVGDAGIRGPEAPETAGRRNRKSQGKRTSGEQAEKL